MHNLLYVYYHFHEFNFEEMCHENMYIFENYVKLEKFDILKLFFPQTNPNFSPHNFDIKWEKILKSILGNHYTIFYYENYITILLLLMKFPNFGSFYENILPSFYHSHFEIVFNKICLSNHPKYGESTNKMFVQNISFDNSIEQTKRAIMNTKSKFRSFLIESFPDYWEMNAVIATDLILPILFG